MYAAYLHDAPISILRHKSQATSYLPPFFGQPWFGRDRQETGSKVPLLFYFDQGSSQIENDRSGAICHEQND
jgi:hypothetical protein